MLDQVNAISDSSYAHPIDTASKIHFMRSSDPVPIQKWIYFFEHFLKLCLGFY